MDVSLAQPSEGGGEELLDVRLARVPAWQLWYLRKERLVLGLAGLVSVSAAWELAVRLKLVKAVFVSSPSGIFRAGQQALERGGLWTDIEISLLEWALGFTCAAILGVVVGFAVGWYRRLNYLTTPWLAAWYSTPTVALIPLIILWFGIGLTYKVFYVFLLSFFSVLINMIVGVGSVEASYLEVASSFRASQWMVIRSVVLPGTVPFLLTGLRLGAARALVGVVVAELVGANQGLGFMITTAGSLLDTGRAMLGIVIFGAFGVLVGEVLGRIEHRFDVWRPQIDSA